MEENLKINILNNANNINEMIKLGEGEIALIDCWALWFGICIATFSELKPYFHNILKVYSELNLTLCTWDLVSEKTFKNVHCMKNYLSLSGFDSVQKNGVTAISFTSLLENKRCCHKDNSLNLGN